MNLKIVIIGIFAILSVALIYNKSVILDGIAWLKKDQVSHYVNIHKAPWLLISEDEITT